jgi:hypothetical protein
MSKAVECSRCRADGSQLCGGCQPLGIPAAKLVSGRTQTELLDGPQVGKGSNRSGHNSPVPEVWVLGIVRNPAKPEWCLGLWEEFKPTAISFCAYWAAGSPDSIWSCFSSSGQMIFTGRFAEFREEGSPRLNEVRSSATSTTASRPEPGSAFGVGLEARCR